MPISRKYRSIFVHIPKNAGQSIEKSLGMYGGFPNETLWGVIQNRVVLQHLSAEKLKNFYIENFSKNQYFETFESLITT